MKHLYYRLCRWIYDNPDDAYLLALLMGIWLAWMQWWFTTLTRGV